MRAIITVIGKDTMGIIAGVSTYLSNIRVNILDISQTIMQEYFTMVMMVDLSGAEKTFEEIADELDELSAKLGVTIRIQHEDIFNSMHRV